MWYAMFCSRGRTQGIPTKGNGNLKKEPRESVAVYLGSTLGHLAASHPPHPRSPIRSRPQDFTDIWRTGLSQLPLLSSADRLPISLTAPIIGLIQSPLVAMSQVGIYLLRPFCRPYRKPIQIQLAGRDEGLQDMSRASVKTHHGGLRMRSGGTLAMTLQRKICPPPAGYCRISDGRWGVSMTWKSNGKIRLHPRSEGTNSLPATYSGRAPIWGESGICDLGRLLCIVGDISRLNTAIKPKYRYKSQLAFFWTLCSCGCANQDTQLFRLWRLLHSSRNHSQGN
jgi:hypothetical protein